MKILWVKAGGLVPLDAGGKIRSFHIAKELAKLHQVTLFTFYAEEASDEHHTLRPYFHEVITHPLKIRSGRSYGEAISYLKSFFSALPHSITKYCKPEVERHLLQVLAEEKYDVILCDFLTPAAIVPFTGKVPVIIFTHNVEALIWKRHYEVATNQVWKFVFRREYEKMQAAEIHFLRQSARVLTVSETDSAIFAEHIDSSKITTIPTGVDIDYFRPLPGEEPGTLVFSGSMDWMPNEDGILYFVNEILPLIRTRRPDTKLYVVGRKPGMRISDLAAKDPLIEVTGRVEDIRPWVAKGSAYIVPLRVGSGTRLKIFEAMAMGKAIVSTTIGAEGLPVVNGANIALADQPAEFAGRVCELLDSAELRSQLGNGARKLVEENFSWAAVSASFEAAIRAH